MKQAVLTLLSSVLGASFGFFAKNGDWASAGCFLALMLLTVIGTGVCMGIEISGRDK